MWDVVIAILITLVIAVPVQRKLTCSYKKHSRYAFAQVKIIA